MRTAVLFALAGAAAAAQADVAPKTAIPTGLGIKHMYINMATGERRVTDLSQRIGDQIWGYDAFTEASGFYQPLAQSDGCTVNCGWADGGAIVEEGDLGGPATVDGVQLFYYAAGTHSAATTGAVAYWQFSDDYLTCDAANATGGDVLAVSMDGVVDPAFSWIVTVDLAGFEQNLDGTFGYVLGYDLSASSEPMGGTGPIILAADNPTTAPGAEDAFEVIGATDPASNGCWFYGGAPFAQHFLTLYGTTETGCPADFNGDGFVDGFDYDDFVACFEGDPCPPGKDADFNGDGFPDGFDYDDFVLAFEEGCV